MSTQISFGTDGWRALIADDYTFDNVRNIARALAIYLLKHQKELSKNGVAIGYDTRFLSAEFARAAAETIAATGIPVFLSERDAPTPSIAWVTRQRKLASGIMITASHNPPAWNGFKFFNPLGGPADKDATNAVEYALGKKSTYTGQPAPIHTFDPRPEFFAQLRNVVDFDRLKSVKGKAVYDAVYATGRGYTDALLRECGWKVTSIHDTPDPMFGGVSPDPANERCNADLRARVVKAGANLGFANDPDADRFGIVDGDGTYFTPNQILPILALHLLESRKMSGPIARTVSTTTLLDKIAADYGQKIIETPVGFKWVGAAIENEGAIIGGEESGGLSITGHYGGKDGVLADLLIAEVWATQRKSLGEIWAQITKKYGEFHSTRLDLHLTDEAKKALLDKLKTNLPLDIAGQKVVSVNTDDGVKITLADASWLLFRASGTEPIVRVYGEASTKKKLAKLETAAQQLEG